MKTSPHFCVYTLRDPRDNTIFYVGKGTQKRMYDHSKKAANRFLRERIREIKECGLDIIYNKLLEHEDPELCYDLEKVFIKALGKENLCNVHPGGRIWDEPSEETCNLLSKNKKEFYQTPEGKALSKTFGDSQRGEKNHRFGKSPKNKGNYYTSEDNLSVQNFENEGGLVSHLRRPRVVFEKPPKVRTPWNKGKKTGLIPRSAFKRGLTPWNTGMKMSPEFCKIVSLAHLGHKPNSGCFTKERMAGDNNPAKRPEIAEKIRQSKLGKKRPDMLGDNNPMRRRFCFAETSP